MMAGVSTIAGQIAVVTAAYFIGAFPHLLILARLHRLSTEGDLHISLWQKAGPGWGLFATAVDVLKGIITIVIARLFGFDTGTVVIAALAVTCGQMWPVFKRFDGEKGNTTGFGAAVALSIVPALVSLIPVFMAIGLKAAKAFRLKDVPPSERLKTGAGQSAALPLGVALAFLALPLIAEALGESPEIVNGFAALFGLIMLRRLTAGLFQDLASGTSRWKIFWSRLLLDRPVTHP
ncbi:glycerol-3-phosphate acyltransferase [Dehalogenimonas alkenigignens]|uniref:Glycerol-3-phosphate acyltransferase n=1 Tax=Dehalogenimonas alkenigignens TaxID=1217799 RepID=A0A0W0GH25_9CHLR|nr:glycerol-3-phosphate acyltransferase [Dehalogenimonas alkenigignens]KTB47864.1 Glycerol-3-phosphate acyltransferase [Dehalogenimonas alkenigignens]PVV83939.1 hypothetical protein DD509_04485 [Dehalogenimonas alkenigignens]